MALLIAASLAEILTTTGVVLATVAVLWVAGAVLRTRLPGETGDMVGQLIPVLIFGVIVMGILIIIDPDQANTLLDSTVKSVPKVLVAIIVVIVARGLGRILGAFAENALSRMSPTAANRARLAVSGLMLGIGLIVALQQLGISTDIILILVAALAFGSALTLALAAGLGSVPLARQVVAGRHVSNHFETGQRIRVGDAEGTLTEIGLTRSLVESESGTVEVPNEEFLKGPVTKR